MTSAVALFFKQVYHSSFKVDPEVQQACSCPILPLKSHIRGPAPAAEAGCLPKGQLIEPLHLV